MKRPLILISPSTQKKGVEFADCSLNLSNQYALAVVAGGGMPWAMPCLAQAALVRGAVQRSDGVLLTGGDDIQSQLYTDHLPAKLRRTVKGVDGVRDLFELMLIRETLRQQKPLLAICRGHQILNVALGGTLIVDLPIQAPGPINHRRMDRKNDCVHEVELTRGSLLSSIARKSRFGVNSSHHQAVERVAKSLHVTARSADGVIEALELGPEAARKSPFLLAVQFHPERLFDRHAEHLRIFKSFVRAAAGAKKL
jgi:putative glutamine amidotransferase